METRTVPTATAGTVMTRPVPGHDDPPAALAPAAPSLDGIAAVIAPRTPAHIGTHLDARIAPVIGRVIGPVIAAGPDADPWTAPPADTRGGWVPARNRGGPAVLETTDGGWQLGADPDTGWCVAVYRPGPLTMDTLFDTPTAMVVTVSSPDLEARLGWILPDTVHTAIQSGHAVLPTPPDATTGRTPTGVPKPLKPLESDNSRRPTPSHRVHIPGRPTETYRRALAGSRVLHSWVLDSLKNPADHYRIDIVALRPATTNRAESIPDRKTLVYRLCQNHRVVFAGDDIEVPAGIDLRGDDTLRHLVGMLLEPAPEPAMALSRAQQAFRTRHADELHSLTLAIPAPYPAGTRVAVRLPEGALLTGTVLDRITDRAGTVGSYSWRPDHARLPGHPWHTDTDQRNRIVSPAHAVTATLLPADPGLNGDHPGFPLPYRTTVSYLTDDGDLRTGETIRAVPTADGHTYHVRFPDTPHDLVT
ncbi:hypothetical protein, partial [Frankia sp. Cas4]|uniref:hypothetical protein n=1 Tax=Frankia sp. Cas4 TaxID=3073927 RepID=UPI002AD46DAB